MIKIFRFLRTTVYGIISAFCALALNYLISMSGLMEAFPAYVEKAVPVFNRFDIYIGIIYFIFIAPFIEELIFRFFLFNLLRKFIGTIPAAIVSALIFGAYHLNFVQFVYASIMGLLFAIFYDMDHRFSVPFAMHAFANAAVYLLL